MTALCFAEFTFAIVIVVSSGPKSPVISPARGFRSEGSSDIQRAEG